MISMREKGNLVRVLTDISHVVFRGLEVPYSIEIAGRESLEVLSNARQQQLIRMIFDATIVELGIGSLGMGILVVGIFGIGFIRHAV